MHKIKFSGSNQGGRLALWLATAVLSLGVSASALAAGIANTKHNLSSTGTQTNKNTAASGQLCVFCHTPHGSATGAAVPLWNKSLPAANTFTLYNGGANPTSTIDGEILAVGSVSLACLSCHDGVQAMDNMINAPGSGGYNSGGAAFNNGSWTGAKQSGGVLTSGTAGITSIGKDLTNDHPIGIAYCGGGLDVMSTGTSAAPVQVTGTCNDGDFNTDDLQTATINGQQVYWVNMSGTGRQKTDIALYTRPFSGSINKPSVECGSCHDPHVESKASDNIMFMRVTTAGSAICLACHVK